MMEKLFEVKFLHPLPEPSGQIVAAIFPKSSVEPEVCPHKHSDNNFRTSSYDIEHGCLFLSRRGSLQKEDCAVIDLLQRRIHTLVHQH